MKMLRRVLVLLALYVGSAATAFAADPLDEVTQVVQDPRQAYSAADFKAAPQVGKNLEKALLGPHGWVNETRRVYDHRRSLALSNARRDSV
jgi:hypothetical protein